MKAIISLCDFSGTWSRPYVGRYVVIRVDPKHPGFVEKMKDGGYSFSGSAAAMGYLLEQEDAMERLSRATGETITGIHGILAAPPCTDFAVSGARHFAAKDADGRTAASIQIVEECFRVIDAARQHGLTFWVLENPVGRLPRLVPRLGRWKMTFNPCDYGDPYTKKTCLWGEFNTNLPKTPVEPERVCAQGSWVQRLGGSSERTKTLRSITPQGFAAAFAKANP